MSEFDTLTVTYILLYVCTVCGNVVIYFHLRGDILCSYANTEGQLWQYLLLML